MKRILLTILSFVLLLATLPVSLLLTALSIPPVYGETYYAELPKLYDRLKNTTGKKVVIIGTSSVPFGVNSQLLEGELNGAGLDYSVCNFGLYGALGTKLMLDLALPYIGKDDVVLFAPEPQEQTMSLYFSATETWRALDGNLSMFQSIGQDNKPSMVGNFVYYTADKFAYATGSKEKPQGSGVYASASFNDRGDLTNYDRNGNIMDGGADQNAPVAFSKNLVTDEFSAYVNAFYKQIKNRGAEMYFTFAPVNNSSTSGEQEDYLTALNKFNFSTLGTLDDALLDKEWFFDSNFHLNASGSIVNTYRLVDELYKLFQIPVKEHTMPEKPALIGREFIQADDSQADFFTYAEDGTGYRITGIKTGAPQDLILPSSYQGKGVWSITKTLFKDNTNIKSIVIPENVASLYDGQFDGCINLQSVTLRHSEPQSIGVGYALLSGAPQGVKLYVDEAAISAFRNNYFWSNYATSLFSTQIERDYSDRTVSVTAPNETEVVFTQTEFTVAYGGEFTLELTKPQNTLFRSSSYENTEVVEETETTLKLLFKKITKDLEIQLYFDRKEASILYDGNGGTGIIDGVSAQTILEGYDLSYRQRVNTQTATAFKKQGYTLTSWNEKADGSGLRVGLGSRYTLSFGQEATLFAQWEKWTDGTYGYEEQADGTLVLTSLTTPMPATNLVFPEEIGGKKVAKIAGTFTYLYAQAVERIVFPSTIKELGENSFKSFGELKEIVIFDNIEKMDGAFGNSIETLSVNAILPPVYQRDNDNAYFADKIDRLILTQGQKRLLFFAGCSMSYGLDSEKIKTAYPDYEVINLGVIGGISASFQFDIISQYITEKDIFIHAPEVGSGYQLMADETIDNRIFVMMEGNYDLFRIINVKDLPVIVKEAGLKPDTVYTAWEDYITLKKEQVTGSYLDVNIHYNIYGDIVIDRSSAQEKESYNDYQYAFEMKYVTDKSVEALARYYQKLQAKGATVLFSFSPTNKSALNTAGRLSDMQKFEAFYKENLPRYGVNVISDIENYTYTWEYFYDADYHLNEKGAALRTQHLIDDLYDFVK